MGAGDVAVPQLGSLEVAVLVEAEQRVVASLAEVPVVGGAFLLSVGRADGTVHVKDEPIHSRPGAGADHPLLVEIGEGGAVLLGREDLRLEPAHLARGGRGRVLGLAADDVTNDGIDPKALGVVGVRVSRETTVDRLAQETREPVGGILAAAGIGEHPTGLSREPEDLVELSVGQEPCVARNARAMELELQPAVELEPERPLSRFTHWIPPPEGVSRG